MNARTRRLIVGSTAAGLACGLAAAGWLATGALPVGVGHKAKTLCSGVFVSRLDPATVLSELQADDLAILKRIDAVLRAGRIASATHVGGGHHAAWPGPH